MKTITEQFESIIEYQNFDNKSWLETSKPYVQAAFYIVALFAANSLIVTIWRSMTGH
jgi:hypothetical protein